MPSEDTARRLRDILDSIARIHRHMDGLSLEVFLEDEKTQDAVERCLERIAVAARKIGDSLDCKHPEVEFHKLRQFGSVLRHDYDGVDADLVWLAATKRLPLLEAACRTELGEP